MRSRGWSEVTVGERSRTVGRLAVGLLVFLALGCRSVAQAEDYSERIIWWNEGKKEALFIPEKVLNSMPLEQLPMSTTALGTLTAAMGWARSAGQPMFPGGIRPERVVPECTQVRRPPEPGSAPWATSFEERVRQAQIVIVARVIAKIPGWSLWRGETASAIYLRIEEAAKGAGPPRFPAGVVVFLHSARDVQVHGVRLCLRGELPVEPRIGDQILLTGGVVEGDPLHVSGTTVNLIESGIVKFVPSAAITDRSDVPLTRLLEVARAAERSKGDPQ